MNVGELDHVAVATHGILVQAARDDVIELRGRIDEARHRRGHTREHRREHRGRRVLLTAPFQRIGPGH